MGITSYELSAHKLQYFSVSDEDGDEAMLLEEVAAWLRKRNIAPDNILFRTVLLEDRLIYTVTVEHASVYLGNHYQEGNVIDANALTDEVVDVFEKYGLLERNDD